MKRFNNYGLKDIQDLQEKPKADFVIKGLEKGMIGFLVGNGGAGKGFWLLNFLFASVGKTDNFLFEGLKKKPKIGYFSFEDNYKQFGIRAFDCNIQYQKEAEEDGDFKFFDYSTSGGMFKNESEIKIDENDNFEDISVINEMREDIKANNIDFVIIDTLSVINQKYNENCNREMATLLEELKKFARETNTAVLMVHHTNKTAINANNETNEGNMRGASSLIGNARFVLTLEKAKLEDPKNKKNKIYCKNWVEVRMDKVNFIKPESRIYYRHANGVLEEQHKSLKEVKDDLILEQTQNRVGY